MSPIVVDESRLEEATAAHIPVTTEFGRRHPGLVQLPLNRPPGRRNDRPARDRVTGTRAHRRRIDARGHPLCGTGTPVPLGMGVDVVLADFGVVAPNRPTEATRRSGVR
ncbi:hypothetical protein B4N89_40770 [Embleya scabrispora]|uniref:Uncharacterized protein n=1 Tax=Embleya scabrispora TaxID=159449 RepID=A0A1T3NJE0_9ACTN|nr:hypothetical protein B4N89_40770 [Embleya scabrispora]